MLRLPKQLHTALRHLSVDRGVSLNAVITEVLEQWWDKQPDAVATQRRGANSFVSVKGGAKRATRDAKHLGVIECARPTPPSGRWSPSLALTRSRWRHSSRGRRSFTEKRDRRPGGQSKSDTMRVFSSPTLGTRILWPTCKERPSVATIEDEDLRPFSLAGDREGYVAHTLATKRTRRGITPPRFLASRWFNQRPIVASTEGDFWIHREKTEVWWTTSRAGAVEEVLKPAFKGATPDHRVYEIHKPADVWSNKDRRGARLLWDALHPKAQAFLFTEGTLQQLGEENAEYAEALVDGEDLSPWHNLPAWRGVADSRKHGAARVFDARQMTIARMVRTALDTVAASRGQQVERTVKRKESRFPNQTAVLSHTVPLVTDRAS